MIVKKIGFTIALLLAIAGCLSASKDCDYDAFSICLDQLEELESGDFDIVSEEQMKEVCNTKKGAIECATDFIEDCMKKGEKDLFEATTGGKLKVVDEMCTEGSKINRGYLENMNCWGKVQDDLQFCNDKFNQSQRALLKSDMLDRLKVFYGCCAFEWHRNCLAKMARAKCSDEAGNFVYHVATVLGGNVQSMLCSSSYSSCHGLHGVDEQEIQQRLEKNSGLLLNSMSFLLLAAISLQFLRKFL